MNAKENLPGPYSELSNEELENEILKLQAEMSRIYDILLDEERRGEDHELIADVQRDLNIENANYQWAMQEKNMRAKSKF